MSAKSSHHTIANNVIGHHHHQVPSPFGGHRTICYADFTASGQSLQCIEDYIQQQVMPFYGNTHTITSITGRQTTWYRQEAREIIADAVNARILGSDPQDTLIFTGQGTTSAIHKLVMALGLHLQSNAMAPQRPVVFVGPFEHHSNLLPWRESHADVVMIPEDESGHVDVDVLIQRLQEYAHRPVKIGTFSAASNLTGVLTDVDSITATLHTYGALAFWDYASCAPYVPIDMNPDAGEGLRCKDAIFFSGHKFIGGPGSPGVLVIRSRLLNRSVPTVPGGGTVFFVTERDHRYLSNKEEREEGGTPDILGSIRLGLAFQIKQRYGPDQIMARERAHVCHARESFAKNEKIVVLGRDDVDQLPIFSFLIRCGDRFLHYNFVCALLNDLFGIQSRGGCQCAGPYAMRLLGIAKDDIQAVERALVANKCEGIRSGFSRLSFPYFMDDEQVDYILEAIHFIAEDGWRFLPQYELDVASGRWDHTGHNEPVRQLLSDFSLDEQASARLNKTESVMDIRTHRRQNLITARRLAASANIPAKLNRLDLTYEQELLRWFVSPVEAARALSREASPALSTTIFGPFQPHRYRTGVLRQQWDLLEPVSPGNQSSVLHQKKKMGKFKRIRQHLRLKHLMCTPSTSTPEQNDVIEGNHVILEASDWHFSKSRISTSTF
ncbi:hypothetical protein Poli38472_011406 [Pythium oligandrum]|uniref:Aminotransferase class V domain-containing protein n=1 Tax=Pythium oligandrum TaxID=41045 RepID=A0A8K1CKR3_PYTOL|nr:hypothetical protein Poli38472_011406 [Pythium oligandrum]|eukprot:TMW64526.1 hypothetical protein Poli38472_011406 [Pythium oligandrum]